MFELIQLPKLSEVVLNQGPVVEVDGSDVSVLVREHRGAEPLVESLGGLLLGLCRSDPSPVLDCIVGGRDGSSGDRHGQCQQQGEHDVFPPTVAVLRSDVIAAGTEHPESSGDQRQQHHLQRVDDESECDEVGHSRQGPDQW